MADGPIYLDHNASTPLLPEALEALTRAARDGFANPSSSHVYGKRAKSFVEAARAQVASLIGAQVDEIVFTSGCTEANNLALAGSIGAASPAGPARARVVTSSIEHPATASTCDALERRGAEVVRAGVDDDQRVRVSEVAAAMCGGATVVSIIHAHNETGVLQPIGEIVAVVGGRARVHTDAAQSVGKIDVDVRVLGVDLLSIAGHKLGAPKGVGALFVRRGITIEPVLRGAAHERGLRPGTENVAGVAAFGAACAAVERTLAAEQARQRALRDRLLSSLRAQIGGGAVVDSRHVVVVGEGAERLPNTLYLRFTGVDGAALLARCPGVAASTGSACHDGDAPFVRLSIGRTTSDDDVDRAAVLLERAWRQS